MSTEAEGRGQSVEYELIAVHERGNHVGNDWHAFCPRCQQEGVQDPFTGRVSSPLDKAMTDLCKHREWLRSTATDQLDRGRIAGVSDAMDILAGHGGRCTCPSAEPRRKP
jgi:hypothetical protein